MSRKLALSSALSVMMMAAFALFGTPAAASVDGHGVFAVPQVSAPALPGAGSLLLPLLR